jgi:hypothetical protein
LVVERNNKSKQGLFTESSPYRDSGSAISEAKEIHGKDFDPEKHVEMHLTDVFDSLPEES